MTMPRRRHVVCVSTTRPSTSVTPGGGGGSLTIIDPRTGAVVSSLRLSGDNTGRVPLGLSKTACFPLSFASASSTTSMLMLAYGGTNKRDDTYGVLLSLRTAALPPVVHWKCRLPEAQLSAGLSVSPCGYYIVGGGASGKCFIWSSLGGSLIRTWKSHYQSVSAIEWSNCGRYLITGGSDGMSHLFSLMDLVEHTSNEKSITPCRTWSVHHLPVTALVSMPSSRVVSASEDGQLILIELFSESVVATIQLPHGIRSVALQNSASRILAGCNQGTIYMVDLDVYAMHQTSQLGAKVKHADESVMADELVFGSQSEGGAYQNELQGHEKPITQLSVLVEDGQELLVSGDEGGSLRVWDLASRGCIRIIQPWHNAPSTTTDSSTAKSSLSHPVTSIVIIPQENYPEHQPDKGGLFAAGSSKSQMNMTNLISPLQKFKQDPAIDGMGENQDQRWMSVPLLCPRRDVSTLDFWHSMHDDSQEARKRRRIGQVNTAQESTTDTDTFIDSKSSEKEEEESEAIASLRQQLQQAQEQLAEANCTIQRWEKVNNKLMAKLKGPNKVLGEE